MNTCYLAALKKKESGRN
jgi:hypothetical protein